MFPIRDILLLTFILGSLPFCFIRPFYGVLLWTGLAFLNPQWFAWGIAREVPLSMVVAIPTLLGFLLFSNGWKRLFCREVFLLVLLWVWFTLTTLWSTQHPLFTHHAAETWFRWEFTSKILLMTVVVIGIIEGRSQFRWFLLAISGSFGLLVLKTIPFMIRTGGAYPLRGPEYSMISDNNDFALALNMALPLFLFHAKTESDRRLRWLFKFLFVATIPAILFTYSRGGVVGLTVVLFLMVMSWKHKAYMIPILAFAILFAVFFTPQHWRERMSPTRQNALDGSARGRLNSWTFSWRLAVDNPLMGGGFDTYSRELFERYAPDPRVARGYHSIYFGVLAEHGFTGLALYLTLLICCFARLRRLVKFARFWGDGHVASCAAMLQISLIAFLVSGTFLGRQYFDLFFALVACVAILKRVASSQWDQSFRPVPQTIVAEPGPDWIGPERQLVR